MTKLKEECGIFGIFDAEEASVLTTLGLHSLQHRGQEGAGIVSYDGKNFYNIRKQGLVGDNFNDNDILSNLPGKMQLDMLDIQQLESLRMKIYNLYLLIYL